MTPRLDTEVAVRRELLHLALKNSTRSVPLQLIAVAVVVAFGAEAGVVWAPVAAAVIGLVVAVWRYSLSRRYGTEAALTEDRVAQATWELEGNSILAGLLWVVCSLGIYPLLNGTRATTYVVIAIGSVATAALFMSLVGRSFNWLQRPQDTHVFSFFSASKPLLRRRRNPTRTDLPDRSRSC